MVIKLHPKVRDFALLVLVSFAGVAVGAVLPDSDHLIKGQARTWGHDWRLPCIVFALILIALVCRYIRSRLLR